VFFVSYFPCLMPVAAECVNEVFLSNQGQNSSVPVLRDFCNHFFGLQVKDLLYIILYIYYIIYF
jgi:hypothetical protein